MHKTMFEVGQQVIVDKTREGRIIALTKLFGQEYADVFLAPDGPIRRVPLDRLSSPSDDSAAIPEGKTLPAPLFLSTVTAYHLKSLLTQQGLLSAANFRITSLPHQILAVDFVLGKFRPRALIAEEVGLGKTIEAAMIFEELKLRHQAKRVLIITPAGITRQWQDELNQKFGEQFMVMDRPLFNAMREMNGPNANLWLQGEHVLQAWIS